MVMVVEWGFGFRVALASGPPYNVCKEEIPGKCGVAYRNKN
jgi:hypothetical protein